MAICCSSRCSVLKVMLALHVFWFRILISDAAPSYRVHLCQNTTTYDPNSTYKVNLNSLLSSLASNDTRNNLFYNTTAGKTAPDKAYGLFLCRGDLTNDICHDCVATATKDIVQNCPREREAYIWYDECMLRYNNRSFFSTMDVWPGVYMWNFWNLTDASERDRLVHVAGNAMNKLAARASNYESANGEQLKGFATGETDITRFIKLYTLVQCTPDISGDDCNRCFHEAIGLLPTCCSGRQGGRVLFPSCNIRFETYPFYRMAVPEAPSPAPRIPPSTSPGGDERTSTQVIIAIVVTVAVSISLFSLAFFFLRRKAKKHDATGTDENVIPTAESLQYDLSTIEASTNNFSAENKVGEGGFGDVFKGTLPNGQEVAVKRLSRSSGQGAQEFKNEVTVVAKLQHKNLVRLVGFCLEREEKILIYEFVLNKSLDYFLFDPEKRQLLDWSLRYKIIGGIAQGILYLHEHSRLRIIHRDLKTSNILLDGDMNPKISDFGMARIFGIDQSQANTNRIVGTFGYMAPEYAMHGKFSIKSDIFSFGVLILEIVSGKKNNNFFQLGGSEDLLSHAWKLWRDGTPLDLIDPTIGDFVARNEVIRCINIGLLCVQENADERPNVALVVHMLNSNSSATLPLPRQPALFDHKRKETVLKQLELDVSSNKSLPWSANELSITELYPR